VTDDPAQSSFHKAIALSKGVVSVIDTTATCYTRIWCDYEVYVAITTAAGACTYEDDGSRISKTYDMVTYVEHKTIDWLLNQGEPPEPEDKPLGEEVAIEGRDRPQLHFPRHAVCLVDGNSFSDCNDPSSKMARERFFPMEIVDRALDVDLAKGNASVQSDKVHILNSICGVTDLNAPPPKQHSMYDLINSALHSRVASARLRVAVEKAALDGGVRLQRMLDTFVHAPLVSLQVSFQDCEPFTPDICTQLCDALPVTLQALDIGFGFNTSIPESICRLVNLTELRISDTFHPSFNERGVASLPDGMASFSKLKYFRMTGMRMITALPKQLFVNMNELITIRLFRCSVEVLPEVPPSLKVVDIEGHTREVTAHPTLDALDLKTRNGI